MEEKFFVETLRLIKDVLFYSVDRESVQYTNLCNRIKKIECDVEKYYKKDNEIMQGHIDALKEMNERMEESSKKSENRFNEWKEDMDKLSVKTEEVFDKIESE